MEAEVAENGELMPNQKSVVLVALEIIDQHFDRRGGKIDGYLE